MQKYLKHLKIKNKIMSILTGIMCIFVFTIVVLFVGISLNNSNLNYFYQKSYVNSTLQMEIRKDIQYVGKNILWATLTRDKKLIDERISHAQEGIDRVQLNVTKLNENFDNDTLLNELKSEIAVLADSRSKMIELVNLNRNEESLNIYNEEYAPATENVQNILLSIGASTDEIAKQSYSIAESTAHTVYVIAFICTLVAILMGVYITVILTRLIVEPVAELELAAKKLSKGELDIEINYQSKDELGILADAFRQTCSGLKAIIKDLMHILNELSSGNFMVKSNCKELYVGEYKNILENLRQMMLKQNSVILQIDESSERVAICSNQVSESTQSLSGGTAEQASAVEELTAAIEDITSLVVSSADNADRAYDEAKNYMQQAQSSNRRMKRLATAMERINDTSKEIENIIAEIENIASQTNLLSLNASIEASRAGEAGSGFAVVANQIGKLATDSAESAVHTKELIKNALDEIKDGNDVAHRTQEALEKVIEGINFLSNAAKNASNMSASQATAMKEIESGIEQISEVVQSNSALAQQTSAVSQELSTQAISLDELVKQFNLVK